MLYDYGLPLHVTSLKENPFNLNMQRSRGSIPINKDASNPASPLLARNKSGVGLRKGSDAYSKTPNTAKSYKNQLMTTDKKKEEDRDHLDVDKLLLYDNSRKKPSVFSSMIEQPSFKIQLPVPNLNEKPKTMRKPQSSYSQSNLLSKNGNKIQLSAMNFSVKHPNLIFHPKSLKHTFKFETVSNPKPGKALQQPAVQNVKLDHFSTVNIVKEKKQYQRYMKNKLKEFLKDYRKDKEDKMEQDKEIKKKQRLIEKEERVKQSQLKNMSINELEKIAIEEQMQQLDEDKQRIESEIKSKYVKIDKDHRQIMYKGDDGKLKHVSVYRPCTENTKIRLSRYFSIEKLIPLATANEEVNNQFKKIFQEFKDLKQNSSETQFRRQQILNQINQLKIQSLQGKKKNFENLKISEKVPLHINIPSDKRIQIWEDNDMKKSYRFQQNTNRTQISQINQNTQRSQMLSERNLVDNLIDQCNQVLVYDAKHISPKNHDQQKIDKQRKLSILQMKYDSRKEIGQKFFNRFGKELSLNPNYATNLQVKTEFDRF
eukprot:403377307